MTLLIIFVIISIIFSIYLLLNKKKGIFLILILIWIFLPLIFLGNKDNATSWNNNYILLIDVSTSMNTRDIKNWETSVTRIEKVKNIIKSNLKEWNNYWINIFSWNNVTMSPLTNNIDFLFNIIDWLDWNNITWKGTNIYNWISETINMLWKEQWTLIIFTDWWDEEIDIKELPTIDKDINIIIYWMWSIDWWIVEEWNSSKKNPVFKKYKWEDVISKLNTKNIDILLKKYNAKKILIDKNKDQIFIENNNTKNSFNKSNNNLFIWLSLFFLFTFIFSMKKVLYN